MCPFQTLFPTGAASRGLQPRREETRITGQSKKRVFVKALLFNLTVVLFIFLRPLFFCSYEIVVSLCIPFLFARDEKERPPFLSFLFLSGQKKLFLSRPSLFLPQAFFFSSFKCNSRGCNVLPFFSGPEKCQCFVFLTSHCFSSPKNAEKLQFSLAFERLREN